MISAVHLLCVGSCASLYLSKAGSSGGFSKAAIGQRAGSIQDSQSTSRKPRSSWYRALRLSQPTDLVKKTTADALLYACRMKDEEKETAIAARHTAATRF